MSALNELWHVEGQIMAEAALPRRWSHHDPRHVNAHQRIDVLLEVWELARSIGDPQEPEAVTA